jgi:hypothetical protein
MPTNSTDWIGVSAARTWLAVLAAESATRVRAMDARGRRLHADDRAMAASLTVATPGRLGLSTGGDFIGDQLDRLMMPRSAPGRNFVR